jgi:hypothetical protein
LVGRWAGPHFLSYLFFTNAGQLWFASLHCVHHWSMVSRIYFWWRPTHSTSQVRVIAGELVGNGFLADETLLTCSFRVSN